MPDPPRRQKHVHASQFRREGHVLRPQEWGLYLRHRQRRMKSKPIQLAHFLTSTRTKPSSFTGNQIFYFFNLRLKCAARLSTNLSDNLLCKQSDNLSTDRARSATEGASSVKRCVMWVQVLIYRVGHQCIDITINPVQLVIARATISLASTPLATNVRNKVASIS